MNAIQQAQTAYGPAQHHIRTPRAIEAQALSRVTSRLRQAGSDFPALARAIHDNRTLWTVLAADVAGEGNNLPKDLRAQLFYLSEFTEAHSRKVLRKEADAQVLIDINLAVIRGLSGSRVPG